MRYTLATSLSDISIPDKFLTKLHKLGLNTVEDLLFHMPRKYTDYSNLVSVRDLYSQESGSLVTIIGTVVSKQSKNIKGKKLRLIEVMFEDETGRVKAVWFNQAFILKQAQEGMRMAVAGAVQFSENRVNLRDATLEPVKSGKSLVHTGRLVAEYPTTHGIRSRFFRYQIASILSSSELYIQEYLPQLEGTAFPSLLQSLRQIHFPQTYEEAQNARYRFAFEEAFFLQVSLLQQRMHLQTFFAPVLTFHKREIQQFVHNLPFDLTNDQRKTAWEIIQDTEQSIPMNRLLEGDVGSGKTIVATIALLNTTLNGVQTALMAPTEVLALQHFERLVSVFHRTSFIEVPKVALLTGSEAKLSTDPASGGYIDVSRTHLIKEIEEGNVHLVIGTHALISDSLTFADLGLVLIDEQHRFGVNQRAKLQEKGMELSKQMHRMPHLLSMTATPIPRTLALTVYGDLRVSRITERPPNRKLPITRVVSQEQRNKAYTFIEKHLQNGAQMFVVCPQIEHNEEIEAVSVEEMETFLRETIFPDRSIAVLHGQMAHAEKQKIIEAFRNHEYSILISTTVIEVGVDLPDVNLMWIESAERFGLAQLHQLRGRVGRGGEQAYCFVAASGNSEPERLRALEQTGDGFELAEYDLQFRGPGQFTGGEQSGYSVLRSEIFTDADLLDTARNVAHRLLQEDPVLREHPHLRSRLSRFLQAMHLE